MEFIALTVAPLDRTAQALVWLSSVSPPNHVIGPLGGGRIRHKFFKDYTAPLLFSSVEALQRYMYKTYTLLSTQAQKLLSPVEIRNDRLMFTQSDMHRSNFGIDQHGKTVLMDFAEIGLLPETFVAHTMFSENCLVPIAIALSLSDRFWPHSPRICGWWPAQKLGLDEHGNPKTAPSAPSARRRGLVLM